MAEYSWPAALPSSPLMEGALTPLSNRNIFNPDEGPPISTQKSTFQQTAFPWNFHLDEAQKVEFLRFYSSDLLSGSKPFMATDPYKAEPAELFFDGEFSLVKIGAGLYKLTSSVRRVS